jgi:hypothetical protein
MYLISRCEPCVYVFSQVMLVAHEGSGGYMALKVLSKYKLQVRPPSPHPTSHSEGIAAQLYIAMHVDPRALPVSAVMRADDPPGAGGTDGAWAAE